MADITTIVQPVLDDATASITAQKEEVARLRSVADKHPFYKYNGLWSRELQNLVRPTPSCQSPNDSNSNIQVASVELCAWLGGLPEHKGPDSASFMTIEDVGRFLDGMFTPFCHDFLSVSIWFGKRLTVLSCHSSHQPEGTRCVPPDHRGISPGADCHG